MGQTRAISAVVTLALALAGVDVVAEQAPVRRSFQIIVNPNNPVSRVDRRLLTEVFLKKITRWPNGETMRPVDLSSDSLVRRQFVEDALGRSVVAVKGYWQQRLFSGRDVPPPELDSEASVIQYVMKHPGAIGYVSTGADVGGTKVVALE